MLHARIVRRPCNRNHNGTARTELHSTNAKLEHSNDTGTILDAALNSQLMGHLRSAQDQQSTNVVGSTEKRCVPKSEDALRRVVQKLRSCIVHTTIEVEATTALDVTRH